MKRRYNFRGLWEDVNDTNSWIFLCNWTCKLLILIINIYIYVLIFNEKKKKIFESSPKYTHCTRFESYLTILGNIVLRNLFFTPRSRSSLEENSKRRMRLPSFRSIIGVSHIFFIVRLHLARFDGAVTRLKLHRESNVLAAAPRENARLHRPRGHGQFRRDGNRYVWLLEPINNPLRKEKKNCEKNEKSPRNF